MAVVPGLPQLPYKVSRPIDLAKDNINANASQQRGVDENSGTEGVLQHGFPPPPPIGKVPAYTQDEWQPLKEGFTVSEKKDNLQRKYRLTMMRFVEDILTTAIRKAALPENKSHRVTVTFTFQWGNGVLSRDQFVKDVWGGGHT